MDTGARSFQSDNECYVLSSLRMTWPSFNFTANATNRPGKLFGACAIWVIRESMLMKKASGYFRAVISWERLQKSSLAFLGVPRRLSSKTA